MYRYRQFDLVCPQIVGTVSPQLLPLGLPANEEGRRIVGTASPQLSAVGQNLAERLSFSHFLELLNLEDEVQRAFYEVECIRGGWSVRELRLQIPSLYYERSGLSENEEKLAELIGFNAVGSSAARSTAVGTIASGSTATGSNGARFTAEVWMVDLANQDPFVFELLGLKPSDQDGWQDESERNTWDMVRLTI